MLASFRKCHGRKPVGIYWYGLRRGVGPLSRLLFCALSHCVKITSVVSHKRLELFLFVLRERGNVQPG